MLIAHLYTAAMLALIFALACLIVTIANSFKQKGRATAMNYLIWSNEHNSWWMPNSSGYTQRTQYAGRYTLEEAVKICNGANYSWDADTVRANPMELPVPEEAAVLLEYKGAGERYSLFKSVGGTNGGELIRLKKRMADAVTMLHDLIDGGEECRGYDSAISLVIRKLEGRA